MKLDGSKGSEETNKTGIGYATLKPHIFFKLKGAWISTPNREFNNYSYSADDLSSATPCRYLTKQIVNSRRNFVTRIVLLLFNLISHFNFITSI